MIASQFPTRERIAGCRILVVGDVMLDRYWHGDVSRISPEAPVPIVRIGREECRLGGAANVALNVKALGAEVALFSMTGRDAAARDLRALLASSGIDTFLDEDPKMQTIVKLRVIARNQQMLRIDFEKEPDHEVMAGMVKSFAAKVGECDAVLFSDYGKGGLAHIQIMVKLARDAGKPVLIDPKGSDWTRYRGATVITPNRNELADVMGAWASEEEMHVKARALCKKFELEALLLTRSEDGMTLFEADAVNSVAAEARDVADVTGAGDTVIAVLGLMVACGLCLSHAMAFANRAAGLVVAKFGTAALSYDEMHRGCTDES